MAQILIFSFISPTSTERYSALVLTWHHQLNAHEFEQALGDGEGQRSLTGYSPWGCKELDTTEELASGPISSWETNGETVETV